MNREKRVILQHKKIYLDSLDAQLISNYMES